MERLCILSLLGVCESWIFVWALCERSEGFSSLWTSSTVQARAEQAPGTCCFPKAFQGCLQKSFESLFSTELVSLWLIQAAW